MTLLEIVQEFCRRQGLPVPSAVVSLGDDQLTQIVGLANEICEDLDRFSWTQLVREASWTATGVEDQGAMSVLAPYCCASILNETIYNRTTRLPIYGPVSARQWQADKALFTASPTHEYRIFGGHLYITPLRLILTSSRSSTAVARWSITPTTTPTSPTSRRTTTSSFCRRL